MPPVLDALRAKLRRAGLAEAVDVRLMDVRALTWVAGSLIFIP